MKCYVRLKNDYIYMVSYSDNDAIIPDDEQIERNFTKDKILQISKYLDFMIYKQDGTLDRTRLAKYNKLQDLYTQLNNLEGLTQFEILDINTGIADQQTIDKYVNYKKEFHKIDSEINEIEKLIKYGG